MGKNKNDVLPILLDLHYRHSSNHFEEFYGYGVTHASIEQESYIDLKEMSFERVSKSIKFRKFGRYKGVLTIRMDINKRDYDAFIKIANTNSDSNPEEIKDFDGDSGVLKFNFLHDFIVSNIRDLTREEKIKFKKELDSLVDDESDEV